MMRPKVLVTGVSGYLGSRICFDLLAMGSYDVRGSIRNMQNQEFMNVLSDTFQPHFGNLELVEANLERDESIKEAVKGKSKLPHI